MKLKDVEHEEMFFGEPRKDKFNIHSNRFVLFDKLGRRINEYSVEEMPNYLELEVLEVAKSGYNSLVYFVGFPTTHIKLNILNDEIVCYWQNLKFGEVEMDNGH